MTYVHCILRGINLWLVPCVDSGMHGSPGQAVFESQAFLFHPACLFLDTVSPLAPLFLPPQGRFEGRLQRQVPQVPPCL